MSASTKFLNGQVSIDKESLLTFCSADAKLLSDIRMISSFPWFPYFWKYGSMGIHEIWIFGDPEILKSWCVHMQADMNIVFSLSLSPYIYTDMHELWVCVDTYICVHIYIYVYIYTQTCMSYGYTFIYIHIYIHIHTYKHTYICHKVNEWNIIGLWGISRMVCLAGKPFNTWS